MAVRFLPRDSQRDHEHPSERTELAEVIDLRSRLPEIVADDRRAAAHERGRSGQMRSSAAEEGHEVDTELPGPAELHADAVKLLARRALSSGELRRELSRMQHAENDIEPVIAEFIESLYLDDRGLARTITENLRERKGASRQQIRVKLRDRLIPHVVIEEVLAELDPEEEAALVFAAARDRAKRMNGLDRAVAERRLLGFLGRRGWSGEIALRACRTALDEVAATQRSGVSFT